MRHACLVALLCAACLAAPAYCAERGLPAAPASSRSALLAGYALTKKPGAERDTIAQFLSVADRFPQAKEAPEALLRVGFLRDRIGERPAEWERLAATYPKTKEAAQALHCLGHQAIRAGDPALAAKRYEDSAAVPGATPDIVSDSLVEVGYACISQYWKTKDQAFLVQAITKLTAAEKRIKGDTPIVRMRLALGEAYLIMGYNDNARQQYQAAVDMKSQEPYLRGLAQYELGCALRCKGDWNGAVAAFDSLLLTQPGAMLKDKDDLWRSKRPGYARLRAKDLTKAEGLTGLDIIPRAAYWKAYCLHALGQTQKAEEITDQLISAFPATKTIRRVGQLKAACVAQKAEVK